MAPCGCARPGALPPRACLPTPPLTCKKPDDRQAARKQKAAGQAQVRGGGTSAAEQLGSSRLSAPRAALHAKRAPSLLALEHFLKVELSELFGGLHSMSAAERRASLHFRKCSRRQTDGERCAYADMTISWELHVGKAHKIRY